MRSLCHLAAPADEKSAELCKLCQHGALMLRRWTGSSSSTCRSATLLSGKSAAPRSSGHWLPRTALTSKENPACMCKVKLTMLEVIAQTSTAFIVSEGQMTRATARTALSERKWREPCRQPRKRCGMLSRNRTDAGRADLCRQVWRSVLQ